MEKFFINGTTLDIENADTFFKRLRGLMFRRRLPAGRGLLLAPLLFNGGVHVEQDIAGDDENSWLSRLTALGYKVRVVRDGLGTFENFRALYIERLAVNKNFSL